MSELAALLAVLLTALALIPSGAHLLELANKMRLKQRDYFVAQSLYRGWQLVGLLVLAALGANIWAASVHQGAASWWFSAAATLIALSLVVFFAWTFPVNKTTRIWTEQPADWQKLRARSEYSHATNAAITFLALTCAALALAAHDGYPTQEMAATLDQRG